MNSDNSVGSFCLATTDEQAQALYEACPTVKPTWEQLEETTRDVWRGYVLSGMSGGVLL